MDHAYEVKYHELEQRHAWFWGRRNIIHRLMRSLEIKTNSTILEIGCSGGPLIQMLQSSGYANVIGIDIGEDVIRLCREKGITNVFAMDGTSPEFPDATFDVVISSDVLEHIEHDHEAVHQWNRVLKPGGSLIVFVPAFNFLWSEHDEINYHFRRYSKPALRRLLETGGFEVRRISYWNLLLFLPVALVRLAKRLTPPGWRRPPVDQLYKVNPLINSILKLILVIENWLITHGANFPFGVSVFVIANKPQGSGSQGAPDARSPQGIEDRST